MTGFFGVVVFLGVWVAPSGIFVVEVLSPGFLGVSSTGFLGVSGLSGVRETVGGREIEPVSELDEIWRGLDFEAFFVLTFFMFCFEVPSLFLLFPPTFLSSLEVRLLRDDDDVLVDEEERAMTGAVSENCFMTLVTGLKVTFSIPVTTVAVYLAKIKLAAYSTALSTPYNHKCLILNETPNWP